MVTKNGRHNRLKIGNFGAKLRGLTEKLTWSTSKYQNDILTEDENYHGTQHIKRSFWYLAVLISNFLKKKGLQKP